MPSCGTPPPCTKFVADYGAVGDGKTDDEQALRRAIRSLTSGDVLCFDKDRTYIVSTGLQVFGTVVNDWVLHGRGATLKMADGARTDPFRYILFIRESRGWAIYDLHFDGNRAKRVIEERSQPSLSIRGSADFAVCNVRSMNSVKDGFYVYAAAESDPRTFSKNGIFQDCMAVNSYRNGMSIINGRNLHVIGGQYSNSNGTLPQAGVDIEPDGDGFEPGVRDVLIKGVTFTGNLGYGLQLSNKGMPSKLIIERNYFSNNARGGIFVGVSNSLITNNLLHRFRHPSERGTITLRLARGAKNTIVSNNTFKDIKTGKSVIWISPGVMNGHEIVDNCIEDFDGPQAIESPEHSEIFVTKNLVNPPGGCPNPLVAQVPISGGRSGGRRRGDVPTTR